MSNVSNTTNTVTLSSAKPVSASNSPLFNTTASTWTGGNLTVNATPCTTQTFSNTNYSTIAYTYDNFNHFNILSDYLKESELENLFDTLIERVRSESMTEVKLLISEIVCRRHCSEAFLLKYLEYLSKSDIYRMHKTDVVTGAYSAIALKFECEDK